MDVGFPLPGLVVHRLHDCPGLDHIIQSADSRIAVAYVLCSDQACAACNRVIGSAQPKMVMRLAKPVHAIIGHLRNFWKKCVDFPCVIVTSFLFGQVTRSQEWRIADDDIDSWPLGWVSQVINESIGGLKVVVEVVEGGGVL